MNYVLHMRRKFQDRKAVTIYLDEADYKWVELQASGNISQWCRERILDERLDNAVLRKPKRSTERVGVVHDGGEVAAEESPKRGGKTCEHGTAKGYHCWQCGGLAKV